MTIVDRLTRDLAREEEWLAGDWDSRSARGIATMERHRAKRDELRAILGLPWHCRPCDRDYPQPVVSHAVHHGTGPLIECDYDPERPHFGEAAPYWCASHGAWLSEHS